MSFKSKRDLAVLYAERFMEESGERCTVEEVEQTYSKQHLLSWYRGEL